MRLDLDDPVGQLADLPPGEHVVTTRNLASWTAIIQLVFGRGPRSSFVQTPQGLTDLAESLGFEVEIDNPRARTLTAHLSH